MFLRGATLYRKAPTKAQAKSINCTGGDYKTLVPQHPSEQAAEGEQLSHQLLLAYHSQEYAKMILFEADLWPRR